MNLFEDITLFNPGNRGKLTFDIPDAQLVLWDEFFSKEESDIYYKSLLENTPWREYEMQLFDKTVKAPRMICWYENPENPGADSQSKPFTPELLQIKDRVEKLTGFEFNSVLLNLYRDGKDGVAWHSDHEDKSGANPAIASVSFGETRMFKLRHKTNKQIPIVNLPLFHGTLLFMSGTTNTFWQHQIPKTTKPLLPRINLTFRIMKRESLNNPNHAY